MADQTAGNIVTEALSQDFDSTTYSTAALRYLNDGLSRIARTVTVPPLQTSTDQAMTSGTASYALPTGFLHLVSITDLLTGGVLVELSGIEEYDALNPSSSVPRGNPANYVLYGSNFLVFPTPIDTRTLRLRYTKDPTVLVSGDTISTTTIPDDYVFMLTCFIRSRLFAFEDDAQMSDWWMSKFDYELRKLQGDLHSRSQPIKQVGGRLRATAFPSFRRP